MTEQLGDNVNLETSIPSLVVNQREATTLNAISIDLTRVRDKHDMSIQIYISSRMRYAIFMNFAAANIWISNNDFAWCMSLNLNCSLIVLHSTKQLTIRVSGNNNK